MLESDVPAAPIVKVANKSESHTEAVPAAVAAGVAFTLEGGRYNIQAVGNFGVGGSTQLEQLQPDGATYVIAPGVAAFTANRNTDVVDLPGGTYRWNTTVVLTAVTTKLALIPKN